MEAKSLKCYPQNATVFCRDVEGLLKQFLTGKALTVSLSLSPPPLSLWRTSNRKEANFETLAVLQDICKHDLKALAINTNTREVLASNSNVWRQEHTEEKRAHRKLGPGSLSVQRHPDAPGRVKERPERNPTPR